MVIKMYTLLCILSIFSAREVLATAKVRNLLKITAENGVFLVGNFILSRDLSQQMLSNLTSFKFNTACLSVNYHQYFALSFSCGEK
jgi:hypothetical protein